MSLQQAEWQYLSCVVPGVGRYLHPIGDALKHHFLLSLLDVTVDAELHELLSQQV